LNIFWIREPQGRKPKAGGKVRQWDRERQQASLWGGGWGVGGGGGKKRVIISNAGGGSLSKEKKNSRGRERDGEDKFVRYEKGDPRQSGMKLLWREGK